MYLIALMAAQDEHGGIMKHGNMEECISDRKKVSRMKEYLNKKMEQGTLDYEYY